MSVLGFSVLKYQYYPPSSCPLYEEMASADAKIKKLKGLIEYLQEQQENTYEEFAPLLQKEIAQRQEEIDLFKKSKKDLFKNAICYQNTGRIGRGSNADVYSVKQCSNSMDFALKINRLDDIEEILNERQKLVHLNKNEKGAEFIVGLQAFFSLDDDMAALLLPIYQSDFAAVIAEKGGLSDQEALKFLGSILRILQFLKEEGVIHLDIKPANFFMTDQGNLRLGDFGSAIFKREGFPPRSLGTPFFMSPEFRASELFCDFASDMWSAAVTICSAYLGNLDVFDGRKIFDIYRNQQIRFRKQYPDYLRKRLKDGNRSICPESLISSGPTFEEFMENASLKKISRDRKSFELLLKMLKEMFEFDHRQRITPEAALELLSQDKG